MFQRANLAVLPDYVPTQKPKAHDIPSWWDDPEIGYRGRVREMVRSFLEGKLKGRVHVPSTGGRHIYFTKKRGTELWIHKDNPRTKLTACLVKLIDGRYIGNASSIQGQRFAGSKKITYLHGVLMVQQVLGDLMPMVPFRMFKENALNIDSLQVIEKAPSEQIDVGRTRKEVRVLTHYTGAMLFQLRSTRKRLMGFGNEYFLFDIDRNDLALKNFNAFLSKLSRPCTSIADAYDSLKPQEVKDAERFMKEPCPRQGEWFFIPVAGDFKPKTEIPRWASEGTKPRQVEAILESKGNRPHMVKQLSEEGYVRGRVSHGGHEHLPIELKTWHRAVPNTAVGSFKISGGID